jgi:2-polyprenyl-3-methyl-5-hydroxy-6-metoxy-1,4-benzoquinol methylase
MRAERRGRMIADAAAFRPEMSVLELGCGTGMFTEMFAESGVSIIAVDLSPDLLSKARARNLSADQVRFMEKPFEECSVDGPFDAIVGSSVLHHLDANVALRKIFDLLTPRGRFAFAEPNMLNPQVFLERRFRRFFPYVSPDETAFLRWPLKKQLMRVGFVDVRIIPFDWLHPRVPKSLIKLIQVGGTMLENLPIVREFAGSLLIIGARPIGREH